MKFNVTELPYLSQTTQLLHNLKPLGYVVALESSNPAHTNGRWSIISAAPSAIKEIKNHNELENGLEQLKSWNIELPKIESELPFTGGVIGHASYDLGQREKDTSPPKYSNQPLLMFGLYTWAYLIDHQDKQAYLAYWDENLQVDSDHLKALFIESGFTDPSHNQFKLKGEFTPSWSKDTYRRNIEQVHQYILAGDVYQVNLSQNFKANYSGSPITAYSKLKQSAQVPFACYFEGASWAFASASPELFLQFENNIVTTKPIKGTLPRLDNIELDLMQVDKLKQSEKDRAENLMIVDLLRNDISKNANNIEVTELFKVESFSTVHHLVSTITGEIEPSQIPDLFFDAFPGGSITGAPKKRAMEIITQLEQSARSFYCGSSFYLSCNGKMNSNILIRSFLFEENQVTCWAGGGIVIDSNWEDEYQESLDKISKLMASLN